jgi:hypothetical protein
MLAIRLASFPSVFLALAPETHTCPNHRHRHLHATHRACVPPSLHNFFSPVRHRFGLFLPLRRPTVSNCMLQNHPPKSKTHSTATLLTMGCLSREMSGYIFVPLSGKPLGCPSGMRRTRGLGLRIGHWRRRLQVEMMGLCARFGVVGASHVSRLDGVWPLQAPRDG